MTAGTVFAIAFPLLMLFIVLLRMEDRRGRRFFPRTRKVFDSILIATAESVERNAPSVNRTFARQLFHFIIHRSLSVMLFILRGAERGVSAILRFNRQRARRAESPSGAGDSHLRKIAEHKEESALSEKEKTARKKAALRGDPPIKGV